MIFGIGRLFFKRGNNGSSPAPPTHFLLPRPLPSPRLTFEILFSAPSKFHSTHLLPDQRCCQQRFFKRQLPPRPQYTRHSCQRQRQTSHETHGNAPRRVSRSISTCPSQRGYFRTPSSPTVTTFTRPARAGGQNCPSPDNEQWCGFTTAAPAAVLPDYSAYGSAASSWWAAHSSAAASVARSCPVGWREAMTDTLLGEKWLNNTIIFGGCYADEHETDGTYPKETTGAVCTVSGSVETTLTGIPDSSGSTLSRTGKVDKWMVAGAMMVVAAVNSVS